MYTQKYTQKTPKRTSEDHMEKIRSNRIFKLAVLAALLVATLIGAVCIVGDAGGKSVLAAPSYIRELTDAPQLDHSQFLDNSSVFKLPDTVGENATVSVIITVDVPSVLDTYQGMDTALTLKEFAASAEADAIEEKIAGEKTRILALLREQGVEYTTGRDYDTLLSGFEILISASDFAVTCQQLKAGEDIILGEEYKTCEAELVENTVNVYETGIFKSEDSGYDGSGMVVAVLDTGLDSNHTAFSTSNFTSQKIGLTYEDVAAVLADTRANALAGGLAVGDVYINEKVPFGYDYADNDADVYSTHNNHGTHVSGVIVGKDDVITGVAPNAQLVSMKIFSDVMDTARTSWILDALEDCVVLGVDVINMSIGTSAGFSRESDEEKLNGVYDRIREAGISMVVAASNSYSSAYGSDKNGNLGLTSNPDTGTVGSPSTYEGVMSVASINGVETPYILYDGSIIYFLESNTGSAEENDFVKTLLGDTESKELEYVTIPGVGRSADYSGLDVKGKIALVRRGDNTFEEKALIAEAQGAAGIIIYNNVSGDIKMNVGDAKLATCSISQDDGEKLAAKEKGKLTVSVKQTSGPFISDFSSWGPTPSLQIKPELTAHGGNILSSITGGGYDRLSGTSMACPNTAGVVVLMRQYVVENFPEIADDSVAVNAMIYRLLMSTADITLAKNGQPYAVRKQGAGLANLMNAIGTTAVIITKDGDGEVMDKTKLELGDDPEKKGIYEMHFTVENFGDKDLTYTVGGYVLTEGVSDTKTNAGETTVTEEAYPLEGASITLTTQDSEGGYIKGRNKLTVKAGDSMDVTVTVQLTEENKKYLDESFENGMYVEGFITLKAEKGTEIDLSVPYLAFYGDWTVAPLLDLDYFQTDADERDDSIPVEDKVMADAYATRPIGGLYDDYVSYLGSYYFLQNPDDRIIAASPDYVALSNQEGTIHSLRFVWAGLLRNAERVEITITDDTTGEVVFETVDDLVRKSYGDGGTIRPANVEIEFDTQDYNLKNNTRYTVRLEAFLDYGDGALETNKNNVFEFPLTVDFEAPAVTDVEYSYEYDETLKKNRLYAKVGIYDNHFAMSSQLGYVTMETDAEGGQSATMKGFNHYMTPVYSQRNSVTYVTYELTDYIYKLKEEGINANSFTLTCYDYALNYATYEIGLPDGFVDFYFDGISQEGLTLSPNEVFSLSPLVYPETEWMELLEFTSSRPGVVRVVNDKLVAAASGKAVIKVRDPATGESITFPVTVLSEDDDGYSYYDKPVADVFRLDGYKTVKAFFMLASEDKELGDEGSDRFFNGNYSLSMYPSESVRLSYTLDSYFPKDTTVEYSSSNEEIVSIDENGKVTANAEGFASVTVSVLLDGESTYYSETVSVEVKDPFVVTGSSLSHYYGNGGLVTFPERLHLTEIGSFAFSNYDYVLKTEEELAFDDAETSKQWYIGESTITKVIVPEGIEKIGSYAFANLTGLEEIVLPSTLEAIEYGAFYGCSKLTKISFSGENNLKIINQRAFENCALEGTVDLSAVCVVGDYAFAGNESLKGVTTGDSLLSIAQYAFAGCKKLEDVTVTAAKVKYGPYAFTDCEALKHFYVNAAVLPEGMFYEAEALESVTIGPDVETIGQYAFRDTAVSAIEVQSGNKSFQVQKADYVLSADGKTLIAVAPSVSGVLSAENLGGAQVTVIGKGALSNVRKLQQVVLPSVTLVEDYGLSSADALTSVEFGTLTKIGEYAFFETAITALPTITGETEIGRYAFGFTKLLEVSIPDGTTLAEGVFSECMDLRKVTIGNNVTLGKHAFQVSNNNAFTTESFQQDGKKLFRYANTASSLTELTIGENVTVGDNAFVNASRVEHISLGAGAKIGYMSFYNMESLKTVDLSQVLTIGDYAFSGDVRYVYMDENMSMSYVNADSEYQYTYHGNQLESIDLTNAEELGEYAFSGSRSLHTVALGASLTELPKYSFSGCIALEQINLDKVTVVGDYAFLDNGALHTADLSAAQEIGEYAFLRCSSLSSVTLGAEPVTLKEAAFSYCPSLTAIGNSTSIENLGPYAFAYTGITEIDLSGAVKIEDLVFLKETLTPFKVTLGEKLEQLGDNPFAFCALEPFGKRETADFNGTPHTETSYTYAISDAVQVIDGSLYCQVPNGLELITYAGTEHADAKVAEGTVRITAYAFAGSDVQMITLPYTTTALGHKAFFGCGKLETVVFGSYEAPILEEEFDAYYYESLEHFPGTGHIDSYEGYDGNMVDVVGNGMLPYFMWNVTNGMYSNVFYGANFVDYVGYVADKLTMVRPVNGVGYQSFLMGQYFDRTIDGAQAADDVTLAAIEAIDAIPERVSYEDKAIVEAARAAYSKVATTVQQALVHNYGELISAEQRVQALAPEEEAPVQDAAPEEKSSILWWVLGGLAVLLAALAAAAAVLYKKGLLGGAAAWCKTAARTVWSWLKSLWLVLAAAAARTAALLKKLTAKKEKPAEAPAELPEEAPEEIPEVIHEESHEEIHEAIPEEIPEETPEEAPKKTRKPVNPILWWVLGGILAAAVLALLIVLAARSGGRSNSPYDQNDAAGNTVSVKFDANGGFFTTNTAVIVDSYDPAKLPQSDGKLQIPLLAPEDGARGKENAFAATKNGCFLAGWYAERRENSDGTITYGQKWDFETGRLELDADGSYTSSQPVLTLYAAWVPLFEVEFYDLDSGEMLDSYSFNPTSGKMLEVPAWDTETGAMELHHFPERSGYTFRQAFYDAEGTQPVSDAQIAHTGLVDEATGTAQDPVMKLYIQWDEGQWYRISTVEQFLENASVSGSYEILADLDFEGEIWPTALMHGNFTGTLRGNGHTLKNITLTQNDNSKVNAGLFGSLADTAVLEDLHLENVTFTIKAGTRVAGTSYGLLAGTVSGGASLSGVTVAESTLAVDSGCYFGTDEYAVGLVCGTGQTDVDYSGITAKAVGEQPENVTISVSGQTVTVEIALI